MVFTVIGSSLIRRLHTVTDNVIEYEKHIDDALLWIWDWVNDLLQSVFYQPSNEVAYYRVYDDSATTFRDIISRTWGQFVEMAAWPLVAGLQATDALYFGNILWPDESAFEIDAPSIAAVYAGDALTWEYYNGTVWTALTLLYDETDSTANDGKQSFQVGGEIRWEKPTDMASVDVDGVTAEWIRVRPTTPANVTTVPVFAYTEAREFVSSVAYVDEGVTRANTNESWSDNTTSSALISSVGEMEATMTSSVNRKVVKRFKFIEPDSGNGDDYGV